jgi:hypothetical protein
MVDYWPQEEGAVFDAGSYILPCRPDGAISEMSSVKLGTTVAGRISVVVSAACGDGHGIALKEATGAGVPSRIPVLFYGACKVLYNADGAIVAGTFFMNDITTTFTAGANLGTVQMAATSLALAGGASYVMGLVLQSTAASEEGLVLVGKCV